MTPGDRLRAWIERKPGGKVVAGFIGVTATADGHVAVGTRAPATQVCRSPEEARKWVEQEASAFGLPVEWMDAAVISP
jgi:hypothetical protein